MSSHDNFVNINIYQPNKNETMREICLYCYHNPKSHSFKKIKEEVNLNNIGIVSYYTKVADAALYYDTKSIIAHYRNELNRLGNKRWIWIFDGEGFSLKHALNISLAKQMAKLITDDFNERLDNIIIRNPNFFTNMLLKSLWLFLDKKLKNKIIYE